MMETITLFEAFCRAQTEKEYIRSDRGSRDGIAVEKDKLALEWQRYDRLSTKLRGKIYEQLKRAEAVREVG